MTVAEYKALTNEQRKTKYNSKKIIIDKETFDSDLEATRYLELKLLERAGRISELQRQVKFNLLPSQAGKNRREKAVSYIADFVYKDNDGIKVVEDVKGVRTTEYILKRKLMLYVYGISIYEWPEKRKEK